jgi:glycosyltransferase involved in cell wall biosynthesis
MNKISIIIPAYNEEKRIAETLEEYGKFFTNLKKIKKLDSEILIVINNTQDKTEEVVKRYQKKYKIIKYLNFEKGGKGFAIMEGFKEALKDKENTLVGFVDADLATGPDAFYDIVNNINNFDGIIASRYISGAKVNPRQTWKRVFVSRIFNFIIRILFLMPYRDTQCGAKLFKRRAIEETCNEFGITQWAFDIDLLYKIRKSGFKIREFPTVWADKQYSKINFMKAGPRMVLAIIRLRLINSKIKFLIRGYDLLPDWMKITLLLK